MHQDSFRALPGSTPYKRALTPSSFIADLPPVTMSSIEVHIMELCGQAHPASNSHCRKGLSWDGWNQVEFTLGWTFLMQRQKSQRVLKRLQTRRLFMKKVFFWSKETSLPEGRSWSQWLCMNINTYLTAFTRQRQEERLSSESTWAEPTPIAHCPLSLLYLVLLGQGCSGVCPGLVLLVSIHGSTAHLIPLSACWYCLTPPVHFHPYKECLV